MRHDELRGVRRGTTRRSGSTLLELTVALALAALTVLIARVTVVQLADDARRILAEAAWHDRDANGERLLRSLVARLDAASNDRVRFHGSTYQARFATWCDMPHGWQELCTVTIAVDTAERQRALVVRFPNGRQTVFRRGFETGELRYLADPAAGGRWYHVWGDAITPPFGIGVVIDKDTLLLRVGERG